MRRLFPQPALFCVLFPQRGNILRLKYSERGEANVKTNGKVRRLGPVIAVLAALLVIAVFVSFLLGRYPISIGQAFGILADGLLNKLGLPGRVDVTWTGTQASLLLNHRLPRILLACLVGCCLSTAGAAYQGVFQNPMAAPDILGASSGAAFGAALAILLHLGSAMVVVMAFCGSMLTVLLVIYTGNHLRGKKAVGLILAGIMIGSLVSSGTSFIKLVADPENELPAITYWLMGSLNGTKPSDVLFALIPMVIGCVPLFLLRWRVNVLTMGDDECRTMGVNASRLRVTVILLATLITAASVSVSGTIGWIGLVIPHFSRRLVGNNYKKLMPVTMLFGALFLLLVDDVSRNLFTTEIPIGILTSVIGVPFFLYLISGEGDRL
ncbi:MAG: iron ABC transporter permease [Oscillospiraceae bacterium]|nr:iron ABC transporter permease [Oscillospiraceae bacterium]